MSRSQYGQPAKHILKFRKRPLRVLYLQQTTASALVLIKLHFARSPAFALEQISVGKMSILTCARQLRRTRLHRLLGGVEEIPR